jgi:hypothetical protein
MHFVHIPETAIFLDLRAVLHVIHDMLQVNLIHCNPDGFKIGLCGTPPAGQPRALCKFTFCGV